MTGLAWAWGLLLPVALGWAVARCLAPACPRGLALALGAALGPALTSLPRVGWVVAIGAPGAAAVAGEAVLLAALLALARRRAGAADLAAASAPPWTRQERALACVLALVLVAFLATFAAEAVVSPHGAWDAWSIWNLRARALARCGGDWALVLHAVPEPAYHPDYPLAVPGAVARLWSLVGESRAAPMLLGLQAALAGAALVGAAVTGARGRAAGLLAAAVVLAAPTWARHAAGQLADVPLATTWATALALLVRAERDPAALALAGLAAGLAAWTKNEGLVACVAVIAGAALLAGRTGGLAALAGATPALLAVALHQATTPTNDLLVAQGADTPARLLVAGRWWQVVTALGATALWLWPAPALAAYVPAVGLRPRPAPPAPGPRATRVVAGLVAAQLAAYVLAYVTSPWDLTWHLRTSSERVLLHAWPAAVLLALLVARAPDGAVASPRPA